MCFSGNPAALPRCMGEVCPVAVFIPNGCNNKTVRPAWIMV